MLKSDVNSCLNGWSRAVECVVVVILREILVTILQVLKVKTYIISVVHNYTEYHATSDAVRARVWTSETVSRSPG